MKKFNEWHKDRLVLESLAGVSPDTGKMAGMIPPKPGTLKMSDDDWQHQYTAGNLETIMDDALDSVAHMVMRHLEQSKSDVYQRLYQVFAKSPSHEEIEKWATALFKQKVKLV